MKNVLLVGSETRLDAGVCRLLNKAGFSVTTETSGHSMLFFLASGMPIDLIIMDDQPTDAPWKDCLLSAKHVAPHVPVIILTSHGTIWDYIQTISMGAYEYVHKPIKDHEFMRIVQAATNTQKDGELPHFAA
jgi:two-component system response regulator (stage 0 sporulation protein F)